MVSGSNRPCHREVTGRIGFAREYISDAVATFFTWLPCHEDSIGTVAPGGCLHHTSGANDYDHWFISCMESISHAEYHILLRFAEVEFTINTAVYTLTGLTTDGDDGCICLWKLMLYATRCDIYLVQFGLSLIQEPHLRILVGLEFCLCILHITLINLCELWRRADVGIFQSGDHVHYVRYIYATGT